MAFLDVIIILIFIVQAIFSGFKSKNIASQNLTEYLLAGRSLSGWKAGISMAATQYAADTPLLVTGLVAVGGFFSLWRLWVYGLAFLMMAFLLGGSWRRSGVLTDAELTKIRYSGVGVIFLRGLKGIYYGTIINCVVLAMVLVAAVRIFEIFLPWHQWLPAGFYNLLYNSVDFLGISFSSGGLAGLGAGIASTNNCISIFCMILFVAFYSTTGGLRSVVSTDVVQFFIIMVATLFYAIFAVGEAGGLLTLSDKLVEIYGAKKATQFVSFAPIQAIHGFLIIIGFQWIFQMNSDGTGYLAQRTMACKSDNEAKIAGVVLTFSQVVLRSLLWLPIVVSLLIIYPYDPGIETNDAFISGRELLFVQGITDFLPLGIRGLMITGMLAALASTLDTHLNWGASYWSNDIYKAIVCEKLLKRSADSKELVLIARLSNILILFVSFVIMANLGSIQEAWKISLLFGAGTGSVLVLRWIWERINLTSEIAAILFSILFAPILLFVLPDVHPIFAEEWMKLLLMSFFSTFVVVITAIFCPVTDWESLKEFYQIVSPPGFWKKTANKLGTDERIAPQKFFKALKQIFLCGSSCYFLLIGVGGILFRIPGESVFFSIVFVLVSLFFIPFWWKSLRD
ncbi:MAG: Na+:solute symporter [Leptospiraceae bacterium]|nr:Na+:solute symporter [Leptospiraceae bacterium]